jgi:hypothetical protein
MPRWGEMERRWRGRDWSGRRKGRDSGTTEGPRRGRVRVFYNL